MKNKKTTSILVISGVFVLVFLSGIVFPFMLAASPELRELEKIQTEDFFPSEDINGQDTAKQDDEPEQPVEQNLAAIDINAISEEKAIEIVLEAFPEVLYMHDDANGTTLSNTLELRGARYVEAADSFDTPIWQVLFYADDSGRILYGIHEDYTPEEYLFLFGDAIHMHCCESFKIGAFDNGLPAIDHSYKRENLFVIEVNAFTGELIGQGMVFLCNHIDVFGTYSYDDETDWNLVNEFTHYWVLLPDIDSPQPTPEPRPVSAPSLP